MPDILTTERLEAVLAEPSPELVRDMARVEGDVMVLGAAGKMGPSLAMLAKNALREAGSDARVIAVSRFSDGQVEARLQAAGVDTVRADLLDGAQLRDLPDAPNLIYMAAMKFGTRGREHLTWAMNAYLPGRVAERFRGARIVAFSSGNVYPLTPLTRGGPTEADPTGPVGEYAQSVLGRERIFEHFAERDGTPVALLRLNYANELRYGVLLDVARAVANGEAVDLRMGHVNVIWQGDANEVALRSLLHCDAPPFTLNLTGPETVSVRWLAEAFGARFGVEPSFVHQERETALLNNATKCHRTFGYPTVTLGRMIDWVAAWVRQGGETLDKPTHFQERTGAF